MTRATGLLLVILGLWLIVATLAGRLPERVLAAAFSQISIPGADGSGGPFTGDEGSIPDAADGGGGGGGGGGAW